MNKTRITGALALLLLTITSTLRAQVPSLLNYQGRVAVGAPGVNFDGSGLFKFALVNGDGSVVYWSNSPDTAPADGVPDAAVSLTVTKGLYSVRLGDTTLGANMEAIPTTVFSNTDVHLRVWFDDGTNGSQLLTPDQRLAAVGYAMRAESVTGIVHDGGDIGLGTANPGAALHVKAPDTSIRAGLRLETPLATSEDWYLYMNANDNLVFRNDGSDFVTLQKDSGNVGIGTLTPSSKLEVEGTVTGTAFVGDGSGLTNLPASTPAESPETVFPAQGMAWIKPGKFLMGSRTDEPGRFSNETQHWVTLTKGFWMGVHEVTQAEYVAVTGLANPSNFTGNTNLPVERVSWSDAVAYCTDLTTTERAASRIPADWEYRLPTEAEWEYCSRAGARNTRYGYGDDISATALDDYAWYTSSSGGTTHLVEQKRANPWGLMDMHGNVWEWCQDWQGDYPTGSVTDPQGPGTGSRRVLRGGSWNNTARFVRCASRNSSSFTSNSFGFRVVLAPSQP